MSAFSDLGLATPIVTALHVKGYETPTPIQQGAIPPLLEGKDLLGIAQTGTGKTAAFTLPILHHIHEKKAKVDSCYVRALALTPTRELAIQIKENIETYSTKMNCKHAVIFGGVNQNPQVRAMKGGMDFLVATPGRLLDLMNQGHINLSRVEFLVLDEADRMLDMGFIHDIKKILLKMPKQRQNLLFSATMPKDIQKLADNILRDPIKVEITPPSTTVERITQSVYYISKKDKKSYLPTVLQRPEVTQALIFSRTKHGANKIVQNLEKQGVEAAAIHGGKSQNAREKALKGFRAGKLKFLVATDIAARGIDVPDVSHVINYDLPTDTENYVHRIGRTARAGREGVAISFCCATERSVLHTIEKSIHRTIHVETDQPFHMDEETAKEIMKLEAQSKGAKKAPRPRRGDHTGKPTKRRHTKGKANPKTDTNQRHKPARQG